MFWGHEKIKGLKATTINDYWQWTYSDLMITENRRSLGLFLIANSLELTNMPRINWGEVDLRYKRKKISIDVSSRIQSWKQSKSKRIQFNITKKKGIHAKNEHSLTFKNREAEFYIFGLHLEKNVSKADLLNLNQWEFYVISTKELDAKFPNKNKIGIRQLKSLCAAIEHKAIKKTIDTLIESISS